MPLQPLKYAPNGRRLYFIGFKCAIFLTNAAVSEKKQVKTWPIEIVLRMPLPLNRLTAEIKFPVVARMRNCFGNYLR